MFKIILHLAESVISGYSLYYVSIAIPNLQKWESKSKQAAQYSSTAAEQRHRTQMTEGVGLIVVST
jgi:hypothetical protein